jgi:hypothetical protein
MRMKNPVQATLFSAPVTDISPIAWEAAMAIEGAVGEFLIQCGMMRFTDRTSAVIPVLARFVQQAINASKERPA